MERNWLIRTSQNQILGPVAKEKLVEFLQKGALGLTDEVSSGNGYWFALKEKDLVDKYLYGDIPQSYNPISEATSVLSKKNNPDKTTSINSAPANKSTALMSENHVPGVLPAQDDLELPDITLVGQSLQGLKKEEVKIPESSDLEFPDLSLKTETAKPIEVQTLNVVSDVTLTTVTPQKAQSQVTLTEVKLSALEEVVYPKSNDLDFPELETAAIKHDEIPALEIAVPAVEEIKNSEVTPAVEVRIVEDEKVDLNVLLAQKVTIKQEEKKLLHERKIKSSAQQPNKESEKPVEATSREIPEKLKKRNDNYLVYILIMLVLLIIGLFFYYYNAILNKPLPV